MAAALLRGMRMGEVPGGIGGGRSSTMGVPVGWGMSNIGTALARSAGRFRGANPTTRKQAAGRPRKRYVLSGSKEKCAAHYKRFQAEQGRFLGKKPKLRIRCLYCAGPQGKRIETRMPPHPHTAARFFGRQGCAPTHPDLR